MCCSADLLKFSFPACKEDGASKGVSESFAFCLHLFVLENGFFLDIPAYIFLYKAAHSKYFRPEKAFIPTLCCFIFAFNEIISDTMQESWQTSTNMHHHWCKHLFYFFIVTINMPSFVINSGWRIRLYENSSKRTIISYNENQKEIKSSALLFGDNI